MSNPVKDGPEPRKRQFKNYIIDSKYQMKYTFWLSFSGMALILLNASIFYRYIRENYLILVEMSPMTEEAKTQLFSELHEVIIGLGAVSAVFIFIVFCAGIVLSHRTAGPLYHFKRVFETVKRGDHKARVRLRPKDDFQEVANSFNEMMDHLTSGKA